MKIEMGIRQQIAAAKSAAEVSDLLAKGIVNFKAASTRTINSWRNTAKRRVEQLNILAEQEAKKKEEAKKPATTTKSVKSIKK